MNWIEGIGNALSYMEAHLKDDMSMEEIAGEACVSNFYFQKAFSILCGYTVSEYIRFRRLSLAGSELIATDQKIIDIAMEYGYDSPDSFTKAFTRFHGVTPTVVRRERAMIKSFAPLKIQFALKGGLIMNYRIVEKEAFTLVGISRRFCYDTAFSEIPGFWDQMCGKGVCGMYGVCIDDKEGKNDFKYLIADNYQPWKDLPEGLETCVIPRQTWAVFSCKGPLPKALQEVNTRIFSEWLPNNNMYEIAGNHNIEMYSSPEGLAKGTADEEYYSEIWIPVRKK